VQVVRDEGVECGVAVLLEPALDEIRAASHEAGQSVTRTTPSTLWPNTILAPELMMYRAS
jgi:hypothetical protein